MTSTTKHPQQRRYCDQDYHGGVTDTERDRWCFDYHQVRMPRTPTEQDAERAFVQTGDPFTALVEYRSKMRKAQRRWDAFYANPANGYC